jgi:hypothetical protein
MDPKTPPAADEVIDSIKKRPDARLAANAKNPRYRASPMP